MFVTLAGHMHNIYFKTHRKYNCISDFKIFSFGIQIWKLKTGSRTVFYKSFEICVKQLQKMYKIKLNGGWHMIDFLK